MNNDLDLLSRLFWYCGVNLVLMIGLLALIVYTVRQANKHGQG
jgi:uncharacterized protein YqhQ